MRGRALHRLAAQIRDYDWGSRTFLSGMRGAGESSSPEAELWIGAHPAAESTVELEAGQVPLSKAIASDPVFWLGRATADRFDGALPFLLKVLAVEKPLSLQAHPDLAAAARGFERERHASPDHRSYVDRGHKPEIVVALEPFWALRGVRSRADVRGALAEIAEALAEVEPTVRGEGDLRAFILALLGMAPEAWRRAVIAIRQHIEATDPGGPGDRWFWVDTLLRHHPNDAACLSPLFMELERLEPGQAIFQPAGMLHCYLRGAAVEAMASSDNVLRGGLSSKHVDLDELLNVGELTASGREALSPSVLAEGVETWRTPADEFRLSRLSAEPAGRPVPLGGAGSIVLAVCTGGRGRLVETHDALPIEAGQAVAVAAAADTVRLEAETPVTVFAAMVPPRAS
ncbi:MAG: mannose-6-phosphate isomerase, class I [Acidobacteriota bacterium]|nr:mannose-6-phosphate isomerase, class I [Acidobacteriota bacterium]